MTKTGLPGKTSVKRGCLSCGMDTLFQSNCPMARGGAVGPGADERGLREVYSISDVARFFHVSTQTLRYYD